MQAIVVEHLGDKGTLRDLDVPVPRDDEILVRVTAAGVNPVDWKVRDSGRKRLPFVLGQDFAGVVSAVGASVHEYHEGERVFGIARDHGAYAQFTLVPADSNGEPVAHIPDAVGDADAAALPTAGLTALAALDEMRVATGTTLVILGVTGGVGSFAAQIAKSRGALVIGTAHSSHEAQARELGIDDFVAYDREDVVQTLREHLPSGAEAILDLVDDAERIRRMKAVLHAGGCIISTIGSIEPGAFDMDGYRAINLVMNQTPASSHDGLRELARMVEDGTIRVWISGERDFRDATQALEMSKTGSITGKLVLTVESGTI